MASNNHNTVKLKISTTRRVEKHLKKLVRTGYFGKSTEEAAERLMTEALRAQIKEGIIKVRKK